MNLDKKSYLYKNKNQNNKNNQKIINNSNFKKRDLQNTKQLINIKKQK